MLTKASAIFAATMLVALPASAASVLKEPSAAPYEKVSTLVKLPDFLPGLGTLYVVAQHPRLLQRVKGRNEARQSRDSL